MKTSIKKNEMALSRIYNSVTQISGNLKDYIEFCLSNPNIYSDAVTCWVPTDTPKKEMFFVNDTYINNYISNCYEAEVCNSSTTRLENLIYKIRKNSDKKKKEDVLVNDFLNEFDVKLSKINNSLNILNELIKSLYLEIRRFNEFNGFKFNSHDYFDFSSNDISATGYICILEGSKLVRSSTVISYALREFLGKTCWYPLTDILYFIISYVLNNGDRRIINYSVVDDRIVAGIHGFYLLMWSIQHDESESLVESELLDVIMSDYDIKLYPTSDSPYSNRQENSFNYYYNLSDGQKVLFSGYIREDWLERCTVYVGAEDSRR